MVRISAQDENGRIALYYATENGHKDIMIVFKAMGIESCSTKVSN